MIECCILEVKVSVFKKKIRISLNLCISRITHFIDKRFDVYISLLFLSPVSKIHFGNISFYAKIKSIVKNTNC